MALAADERADLTAFLAGLTPAQWDAPTLCAGWRVRDVVAHMASYEGLGPLGVLQRLARGRLRPDRANAVGLAEHRDRTPAELLAVLDRRHRPRGLPAGFGGRIGLLDGLVHHQDIRRPLGLPREIPAERLRPALRFALFAPPIGARQRVRGLSLTATDLDFHAGRGPEVRGPAEALLLAMAGRRGVVDELDGPGRQVLADRIGG